MCPAQAAVMRINGIIVILFATLSTVTLAGPEASRVRGPDVARLSPIRYDGYKYGYSSVGGAANLKSWDAEYPPRYGGDHSSLRIDRHAKEPSGRKEHHKREYDLEYLEAELTKAFLERRGQSYQNYGVRREDYHNRDERFVGGIGHGSEHGSRNEHLGIAGKHGSRQVSEGGHLGSSVGHSSGGGHMEIFGGHANGGGGIESLVKSHQFGGHSSGGGHIESSGGHSLGGEHIGSSVGHESSSSHSESGGGHQMDHGAETGVKHHTEPHHESSKLQEHHGSEFSRFQDRYRDRHEDRGTYGGRYGGRYGHSEEHHLLRDRLPYGNEQRALIGGFLNAGRHKDYKGNYEEHEEDYEHERLEKGLGFIAHKDTSDEHLQLKSYYLKGDSPESYEYHPYRSYRPHGYHRRYKHSSEESKEYYGYKGIYFGSKERTGFIRDYVKSKGSHEKSKSKGSEEKSKSKGSEEKGKSKSIGKAAGLTEEYHEFVKDILKDLDKGLSIKSKSKGKGEEKGEKGDKKGKGNNNGLFGGDLVNVIKVTFDHEERKAEVKSSRRRRSITGDEWKFLDPNVI